MGTTDLYMDQVPQLLLSEFQQARQLLYRELMFRVQHLPRLHAWALKDNLDADACGWSFSQHRENPELLKGSATALLTAIQASKGTAGFLCRDSCRWGKDWRTKAIAQ
jgi:hypothetical protein